VGGTKHIGKGCVHIISSVAGQAGGRKHCALTLGVLIFLIGNTTAGEPAPGETYARVRHAEGSSTVESAGIRGTLAVVVNRPIVPGDIVASHEGRVEIVLADASVVWVDRQSLVVFESLGSGTSGEGDILIDLRRGRLHVETPGPSETHTAFRIDAEAGSIDLRSAGSFRIQSEAGVTHLASFGGVAEFSGDAGSVLVRGGQSSSVPMAGGPTSPRRFGMARRDEFDRFHDGRRVTYAGTADAGVSHEEPAGLPDGLEAFLPELSFHGTWQDHPQFGAVWRPHASATWGPFVQGSWEWYPTGWLWIAAEPWGWAPYHYGRWEHDTTTGWFWIPGSTWSGAWVAFAVGPTHIGWCPLNERNRPVFSETWAGAPEFVAGSRLDPRGWRFVPIDLFASPKTEAGPVRERSRPGNITFVITRTLPLFDPAALAPRPEEASALPDIVRRNRVPLPEPPGPRPVGAADR
jgi:hypothetical protein